METTAKPVYGSVDYYADLLRSNDGHLREGLALSLIDDLANHPFHDDNGQDGSRLDRIRNILAAEKLVRAE